MAWKVLSFVALSVALIIVHILLLVGDLVLLLFNIVHDFAHAVACALGERRDQGRDPLDTLLNWFMVCAAAHYRATVSLKQICWPG